MNVKGMIAPYLAFFSYFFKPESKSQFRLTKDQNSSKKKEFSIIGGVPVTLFSKMLLFIDSNKSFNLDDDPLETMTNCEVNVSLSNPQNLFTNLKKK